MSLWEIYKAKRLGNCTDSLFASMLGKKIGTPFEWITESFPYSLRSSADGANIGSKCKDKIIGGTLFWNQPVPLITTDDYGLQNCTYTSSGNTVTFTKTNAGTFGVYLKSKNYFNIEGHKYLITATVNASSTSGEFLFGFQSLYKSKTISEANKDTVISLIQSAPASSGFVLYWYGNSSGASFTAKDFMAFDLTKMFGSTIADYIYSLEQSKAGTGVDYFRKLFNGSYSYDIGSLQSVNTSAHIMRDAENNIIGYYALDESLTLRGIIRLNDGKLYFDGDTYESNGTVTRKYGIRAYQEGDVTDGSTMITDGTNTVYKLATPTTEEAEPFTNPQSVVQGGTEEYVDYGVLQGTRDVSIPVGHDTEYQLLTEA